MIQKTKRRGETERVCVGERSDQKDAHAQGTRPVRRTVENTRNNKKKNRKDEQVPKDFGT